MVFIKQRLRKAAYKTQANLAQGLNLHQYNVTGWKIKLAKLCSADKDMTNSLSSHIGPTSAYRLKKELIENLQLIYALLSDRLSADHPDLTLSADAKQSIITKLVEGMDYCTPGFHDRVNGILLDCLRPRSLDGLLADFRRDLVGRAASQMTSEVHTHNAIFKIAHRLGYGVQPINDQDPYGGHAHPFDVFYQLTRIFTKQYHPFSMLLSLKNRLETAFSYHGPKTEGYVLVEAKPRPQKIALEPGKKYFYQKEGACYFAEQDSSGEVKETPITDEALEDYIEPGKIYFYQHEGSFFVAVNDNGIKRIPISDADLGDELDSIKRTSKIALKTHQKELIFNITARHGYPGKRGYQTEQYTPGLNLLQNVLAPAAPENYSDRLIMDNTGQVSDIDWNVILSDLWVKLNAEHVRYTPAEIEIVKQSFLNPAALPHPLNGLTKLFTSDEELIAYLESRL